MRLATLLLALTATVASAQPARRPVTYINPLDLDYKYNWEQHNAGISYRSGADPVIVHHQGEYFLFSTVSGGYWHSRDLRDWRFVTPSRWPFDDVVAPAAWSWGDTLLLMQSATQPRPLLYAVAPATGELRWYNRMLPPVPWAVAQGSERPGALVPPDSVQPSPWDPALFRDDDGRWFLYWGSSNVYPLWGIELDPARRLAYRDMKPVRMLALEPEKHGWERFGQDHRDSIRPYMEGAWMTKHRGKYYLQYAAPGTEYNAYANGTYVGDAPLGPFTYAPWNPVSYKPGGFVQGAGHGNTFQDAHGNWWNTGTPWIAVNWNFERRVAMFPAGFDADGVLYASTRFGDFPQRIPTGKWSSADELFMGWMLLSYKRPVVASSTRDSFPASRVTDENPRTFWVAGANAPGQTLTVDLGRAFDVRAVQVNYTDFRNTLFESDSTVYTTFRLHASRDGRTWTMVADYTQGPRRDRPNAYVELDSAVHARYVRWEHGYTAGPHLAVSDLRVFGTGDGTRPSAPAGLVARRDTDRRNAFISWRPVKGAVGYNVRWGIAPGKLYQTYQVWGDAPSRLELRALTVDQSYWIAIEAFDEHGVSALSRAVKVP